MPPWVTQGGPADVAPVRTSTPSGPILQAKLAVGSEDDPLEHEADAVAEAVASDDAMVADGVGLEAGEEATDAEAAAIADEIADEAEDEAAVADEATATDAASVSQPVAVADGAADSDVVRRRAQPGQGPVAGGWEPAVHAALAGGRGRPLTATERSSMEPRMGVDLGHVRIHVDPDAHQAARAIGARAFTVGDDVAFGAGEYHEGTREGRRLLAHELTHVVQQRKGRAAGGGLVQRQAKKKPKKPARPKIRAVLLRKIDVRGVSSKYLRERHDDIRAVLSQFKVRPKDRADDYWVLVREAKRAGTELARRALVAGRTFSAADVKKARKAFVDNAAEIKHHGREECIVILNSVLKDVWKDPKQKHTNVNIEQDMELFRQGGRIAGSREIWFLNKKGKKTTGFVRPEKLEKSVWQAVVDLAAGDLGWSMFGMSIMDGHHAVTLTLDNNDPSKPTVYWSDQTPKHSGGWRAYTKAELDAKLEHLVGAWWDDMPADAKEKTVVRVWRLRSTSNKPKP